VERSGTSCDADKRGNKNALAGRIRIADQVQERGESRWKVKSRKDTKGSLVGETGHGQRKGIDRGLWIENLEESRESEVRSGERRRLSVSKNNDKALGREGKPAAGVAKTC